ncbi:MAG: class I SAM-dependent methyltransferase [Rhodobacteraceae bacterium]|nr:class I SAM-dependent methyltransferase [Paracoccaceae bacterium]
MVRNPQHDMLSPPVHDEASRQKFVMALKHHVNIHMRPANETVFERRAKPAFEKTSGRAPETRREVAGAMKQDSWYQMYSSVLRTAQEMMWDSVCDSIYRNDDALTAKFRRYADNPKKLGSLELDPEFPVPRGMSEIGVHLQPGTYAFDRGGGDVIAGALYEGGGNLYSMGQRVGTTESKAEIIQRFLAERFPDFKPKRILDIGCSAGSSSTPYALAFPDAEVHAIDVTPGLLRYAHARAEALGVKVHFHQRSADDTKFPDGSFDLVVSHNAMHEMPAKTTAGMMKESYRLLVPGGVAVHQDLNLRYAEFPAFKQFNVSWECENNSEPYWDAYGEADLKTFYLDAGFREQDLWLGLFAQIDGSIKWYITCGRKPA